MAQRSYHGPVDEALAGLHEAISAPHRIPMVKVRLATTLARISNVAHRSYLEAKLREIEDAQASRTQLERIGSEIDDWNDRQFSLGRGHRSG
jgi:hypothetical protein